MAVASVLKLVNSLPFEVIEDDSLLKTKSVAHSLHNLVPQTFKANPDFIASLIDKYSKAGELALDPFCNYGAVALEAGLLGRRVFASDSNPLMSEITTAKLSPADIAEVTLKVQLLGLARPVATDDFQTFFAPFYDLKTYVELVNLRRALVGAEDRVSRFVKCLSLGLLHGHTGGFFSVYTNPYNSLVPDSQKDLNAKRKQIPDYRPVVPRIIKRGAIVGRDGIPSILHRIERDTKICVAAADNFAHVPTASVDLTITEPPVFRRRSEDKIEKSWLKLWFSRLDGDKLRKSVWDGATLDGWLDFMNGVLFEQARVLVPGGRLVFLFTSSDCIPEVKGGNIALELKEYVEQQLYRYFECESLIVAKAPTEKIGDCEKKRSQQGQLMDQQALVLRRR